MPSPGNFLPVLGPDKRILYMAPIATVARLIESGRVRPVGTRQRIRKLIAASDSEELLAASRPPTGQRYSHNRETADNPAGVWTFRKLTYAAA